MSNEMTIREWLSVCPDFEIKKIEENQLIDQSLIWGELADRSFKGVSFAYLKHFLVDSYRWSTEINFNNES